MSLQKSQWDTILCIANRHLALSEKTGTKEDKGSTTMLAKAKWLLQSAKRYVSGIKVTLNSEEIKPIPLHQCLADGIS